MAAHGRIWGDRGSGPPWKITKNIYIFSNTGPGPLENYKATHEPPAKRHLNGVSLAGQ